MGVDLGAAAKQYVGVNTNVWEVPRLCGFMMLKGINYLWARHRQALSVVM